MDELRLLPYQEYGAQWLAGKKLAGLFDEQRLGKAVQTISAIDRIGASLVLVVCRGVARANWQIEFEKWSKRRWSFSLVYGGDSLDYFDPRGANSAVITSYESLPGVVDFARRNGIRFHVAVIDESHYTKEPTAQRTRLVLGKGGVQEIVDRMWCLTGTPAPNHFAELWPIARAFGLTRLSYWDFAKKFCVVQATGFGDKIVSSRTDAPLVEELAALLRPKVLRREAKDVMAQLPKMSFSTVEVPPGKVNLRETQFWKYAFPVDRTDEFNKQIESELGLVNAALKDGTLDTGAVEALKTLAKSISTVRLYTALQKRDAALELIAAELEAGAYQKCVIFAIHRDVINYGQRYLERFKPFAIYGGSNPLKVASNLKKFQDPKSKTRVALCNISAAGTSISLSAANHIFFLEESFVPGDNAQAAMRCGGMNQSKPVFVRTFCLENSYDRRVQEIVRNKMREITVLHDALAKKDSFEDLI